MQFTDTKISDFRIVFRVKDRSDLFVFGLKCFVGQTFKFVKEQQLRTTPRYMIDDDKYRKFIFHRSWLEPA